ncbi:hypothetical protein BC834DRAFT_277343 [Gloeopeniophorella convolvens]|nr:hypothetical protein BC834DRAFT_277343 [Gloeopeniophorella convolvens]
MSQPPIFLPQLSVLRVARELASELQSTRDVCTHSFSNATLRDEIAEVQTLLSVSLREISALGNYMRPINHLPPEILAHIFGLFESAALVIPVSQVCQRWRGVALNTPSLWSVIREDDEPRVALCLMRRSQGAMLDVAFRIHMREDGFKRFYYTIAPYSSQVRRLDLSIYGDHVADFYRSLAACDFVLRRLEHLSIRMVELGFPDDTRDEHFPLDHLTGESNTLLALSFRGALPPQAHFSQSIRSFTLADRVVDLAVLLGYLEASPNLEYLSLLDAVPHTFEQTASCAAVTLSKLKELYYFQGQVFDNVLGTVKLFESVTFPTLEVVEFALLLDPARHSGLDLYAPCTRFTSLLETPTELHLEAIHYDPSRAARNNVLFHCLRNRETLASVRVNRSSLESLCAPGGIFLTSSVFVSLSHVTQLTLTSALTFLWGRFFRASWDQFLRCLPTVKALRLRVSRPAEIITAVGGADDTSLPYLPKLETLDLFRLPKGDVGEVFRFLKHRVDIGIPITAISCSDVECEKVFLPEVMSLVESVEFGLPAEKWAAPKFPGRMRGLLEEYLN